MRSLLSVLVLLTLPLAWSAARQTPERSPGGDGDPSAEGSQTESDVPLGPLGPLELAERYLSAYEHLDWETLAGFYADDAVWHDPTSAEIGAPGVPVAGREAIVQHLERATAGILAMDFEFDRVFHSAGVVVNVGLFRYETRHPDPSRSDETLRFELDTVIVLEIEKGLVRRHTDYADFEAWGRQYQEQS